MRSNPDQTLAAPCWHGFTVGSCPLDTHNGEQTRDHDYQRGWDTSKRGSDGALDRADARGESVAWYAGYEDYAAGRPKYHAQDDELPSCPICDGEGFHLTTCPNAK